ncbi:unnamed protein product [Protopolystoma xenopodis]|uniref:Uncharacterized protein n=1 Tax=Protopolystoma xenopodis TaxID=117903 RepID=A0A3S5BA25_9PLAT|nr:unnamed protein product [Protopolystoma xenopodis]
MKKKWTYKMTEQQYARKAIEEVIRLADEKILGSEDTISKRGEDLAEFAHSCEDTIKDLGHYFINLVKQLEQWKAIFIQDLQKNTAEIGNEFRERSLRIQELVNKLKALRDKSANQLGDGRSADSDLVYQVHNCIFGINQEIEGLNDFSCKCLPLKFVGKLNFEQTAKENIGSLEKLADLNAAEILPSKLPKIKLGQLFHLDFRISRNYCEAAKRFLTFTITKDADSLHKVCGYLHDNKNGTYTLSFPITAIIPHTVNVFYLGEHIRNSPYTIVFKVGPNQIPSGSVPTNQNTGQYASTNKEMRTDFQNCPMKNINREMGDERENRRNKWNIDQNGSASDI